MRFIDPYTFRARIQPIFLVILPLGVLFFTWVPSDSILENTLVGLVGTAGGIALIAQLGRDLGSRKQPTLWADWGGPPTTRLLRFRDAANRHVLEHMRAGIEDLVGYPLPTESEEEADPADADQRYEVAVGFLRVATRDESKFPLVFAENVNYGFRRNLWGLKPYGATIAVMAAAGACAVLLSSLGLSSPEAWMDAIIYEPDSAVVTRLVGLVFNVAVIPLWLFVIRPQWVKIPAEAYARRLLESVDTIKAVRGR